MKNFSFNTVRTIINEKGGLSRSGELAIRLGCSSVMVVADEGILQAGHVDKLIDSLTKASIAYSVYHGVGSDPTEDMVYEATKKAVEQQSDCFIGIGGGSVMDVAKAAAVLARSGGLLESIYGIDRISMGRLPLILIPTTAGTGSEVTASSVISHESGKKNVVIDPLLCPDIALLDVDLLSSMPTRIATSTGVDAIVHAIEAYTSVNKKNPISDMYACEALRLLINNLIPSITLPDPEKSRANMLLGSMLAGQAFTNSSVSAVHAFAYALAEGFHLPHGLSNALVLIPLLKFNCVTETSIYAKLAKEVFPSTLGFSDRQAADYFINQLAEIIEKASLNKKLSEFGVKEKDIPTLALASASMERLLQNNPRRIDYEAALEIFSSAL
jgi:alcohol dehydrogenase class IV